MNKKERIILLLLASINFTHILDFMIMMPLGNFLMPHFDISPQYFSMIVAAYPVTAWLSGLIAAFYVDRYDRKKILLFGYAGFIIGTITCGLAPSAALLLVARVLTGLFGGLIGAQVLSIIADTFGYEKRGRAMGTVFMAFSVASIFGVPFSLYLARAISWHAPFIFIGILGALILPLVSYFLPPMNQHLQAVKESGQQRGIMPVLRSVFTDAIQVLALTLTGLLMLGHFLIIPFINPYMEFNVGFTKEQTPLIYMVGGVCALISSSIIGRLADAYGKLPVFTLCLLLSVLPVFLITNMPDLNFYLVLAVFGFWFTFSTGRNIPAQAMISSVVQPEKRGQFMSFNSSFQQLFTGLASLISGLIVQKAPSGKILHYHWVGYLSVTIVLSTLFIARKLHKGIRH
ncbi:MAG TPA: MFS transporter [Chitinophagaceae bacterium]|jgi:predicted MFS family arabinose efflux permease|nr:MFS transporter [Chitinophagaceae bacterium]